MSQDIKMEKRDEENARKRIQKFRSVNVGGIKKQHGWTISQRKKLLSLLYEYPIDAYKNMASKIRGKDEHQVKEFIEKIKLQMKNLSVMKNVTKRAPIVKKSPLDEWLEVATDLVELENVDSSTNLTKVLSVVSHFETPPVEDDVDGPNYKSIYKYLSQITQADRHDDLESLGPIESAIVLDMLHGLMEVLSDYDTAVQRNIMKWKYQLMDARDQHGHCYPELLKRASENDFTEFIEEARMLRNKNRPHERRYVAKENRKAQGAKTKGNKSSDGAAKRKRLEQTSTVSSSSVQEPSRSSLTLSTFCTDTQTEVGTEACTNEQNEKPSLKRHKPGRKGALDSPEVPYTEIVLVMPPAGVEIVNYNPRSKKGAKERSDGKYQPLDPEAELVHNDFSREITYDVHRSELNQFMNNNSDKDEVPINDEVEKKYDPMIKKEDRGNDVPVKKPKLYSINPFCLPVTLLDLKVQSNLS